MIQNLGLVEDRHVYRTILTCDAPGCPTRYAIDTDSFLVEKAPLNPPGTTAEQVQAQQVQALFRGMQGRPESAWTTVTAEDGSERHYCHYYTHQHE